jgi:hypothetical protein
MRFRKTIKIAPGVKLNLSKSGLSTTIGGRGLSVNTGAKDACLNTGIPETGISNRTKIMGGSETSKEQYKENDPLKPRTEAERKTERSVARVLMIAGVVLLIINFLIVEDSPDYRKDTEIFFETVIAANKIELYVSRVVFKEINNTVACKG